MPFDSEITTKSRDLIVLEKARERIARRWWQKGDRCAEEDGGVCVALAFADDYDGSQVRRLLGFSGLADAYDWNDAPDRTLAEVLARFDAAIARLSGERA